LKTILKAALNAVALSLAFPFALTAGFGRIPAVFRMWAQALAQIPGLPGDYVRIAYYSLTLTQCPRDSRVEFGSFFAHPQVRLGHHVYIGSYCILGRTTIGDRTHLASGVQVLSGARQHGREGDGQLKGSNLESFVTIPIGADCWIGAGAIVMAEVGAQATIGAGAVVTRPIAPGVTAVGSPAKPLL
jgi:virginiamycin A acetyltransferase